MTALVLRADGRLPNGDIVDNFAVVRFGDEFLVVMNTRGRTLTRADAEAACVERFPFTGPATKSNPDAVRAKTRADAFCRTTMRRIERLSRAADLNTSF